MTTRKERKHRADAARGRAEELKDTTPTRFRIILDVPELGAGYEYGPFTLPANELGAWLRQLAETT